MTDEFVDNIMEDSVEEHNSILNSVKECLSIPLDVKDFDSELITYINSVIFKLNQIGLCDINFALITGKETFDDLLKEKANDFEGIVKIYLYYSVLPMFDQTLNSTVINKLKESIFELDNRIIIQLNSQ